jgi:eukaryotic-like serine/threonine-protein kinase
MWPAKNERPPMSAKRCCEECGTELPPRAPAGLCPKCLLGQAVQAGVECAQAGQSAAGPSEGALADTCTGRFGDYELIEEIAHGGMGVVYRARQVSLNRTVAVKLMRAGPFASKEFVHRFRTEAAAAAVLQHPNIVAVHEVGVHEGQQFFSMDYVAGQNLAQIVHDGPLVPNRAARYVQKIAQAIQHAHDSGILHRDLKPSNVIIDVHDEPRITDFGLAKFVLPASGGQGAAEGTAEESGATLSGQVIGTPAYMPPEQASGNRGAVKAWSDVYSLGAILYHLLTGRAPFAAGSLEETLDQVLHQDPPSVRLLNPAVPRDLETICLKCLEKEPGRRYARAQLLAEELGRYLNKEPIQARPISTAGRTWRWCRRNPRLASATALTMLSLLLGLTGILWQWRRASAGELLARQNAYAADMRLGQIAVADKDVGGTKRLLEKHSPPTNQNSAIGNPQAAIDLRHWEWRYLWQLCQPDPWVLLHRYAISLRSASFSKDGTILAVRGSNGLVAVWDLRTQRPIFELRARQ